MWATVRAIAGTARAGKCGYCRKPCIWVVTEAGRKLPFDLGFTVRELVTDPRNGVKLTVLDKADRHVCRTANKRSQPRGK